MSGSLRRSGALAFALVAYVLAMAPMIYFVGFLAGRWVNKTIDGGRPGAPAVAIVVDVLLVSSFAFVHSLLARPAAKRWIARSVAGDLERPLYSAIAGLQFVLLLWAWQPLPQPLWEARSEALRLALWALYWCGWAIVVSGVLALGTARLYGLTEAWNRFRRRLPVTERLALAGPYRWIRHPLYTGTILALWAAPEMSVGRAMLATLFTVYILIGQRLEDRDLALLHGADYLAYRSRVGAYLPSSFAPFDRKPSETGE